LSACGLLFRLFCGKCTLDIPEGRPYNLKPWYYRISMYPGARIAGRIICCCVQKGQPP
jgi:hypothetical protein